MLSTGATSPGLDAQPAALIMINGSREGNRGAGATKVLSSFPTERRDRGRGGGLEHQDESRRHGDRQGDDAAEGEIKGGDIDPVGKSLQGLLQGEKGRGPGRFPRRRKLLEKTLDI